jgi:endonuclease/exonuclease/phosphatase family metal-dependent hydrolase
VESVRLLADRIQARSTADPVVVTGDFNATETDLPLAFLCSATSPVPVDTYRQLHPDATDAGTYHDFSGVPRERIDYILASPEWEVLDAAILSTPIGEGYPSDHFPITAMLLLKQ